MKIDLRRPEDEMRECEVIFARALSWIGREGAEIGEKWAFCKGFDMCSIKNRRCSGFTLLEVMLAMAIIGIALTAVLGSQSHSVSLAGEAKFSTTAALLARTKLAEIEIKRPDDLTEDSGNFEDGFSDYYWEISVNDVAFSGLEEASKYLKQIDLKISWNKDEKYQYNLRLYRFVPVTQ